MGFAPAIYASGSFCPSRPCRPPWCSGCGFWSIRGSCPTCQRALFILRAVRPGSVISFVMKSRDARTRLQGCKSRSEAREKTSLRDPLRSRSEKRTVLKSRSETCEKTSLCDPLRSRSEKRTVRSGPCSKSIWKHAKTHHFATPSEAEVRSRPCSKAVRKYAKRHPFATPSEAQVRSGPCSKAARKHAKRHPFATSSEAHVRSGPC